MFLPLIPKEKAVKKFWDRHINEVHPWFKERTRYSVVISASPDFLLNDIAKRLSFDKLICRLYEEFCRDCVEVEDVYSDSLRHDKPIFSLANGKCYHIVKGEKIPFDFNEVYGENTEVKN